MATVAEIAFVLEPREPIKEAQQQAPGRAWSYQDPFLGRLGVAVSGQRLHIAQEDDLAASYGQYLYANLLALADVLLDWPFRGGEVPMVDEPVTLLLEPAEGGVSYCLEALGERGSCATAGLAASRRSLAGSLRDYAAWLDGHLVHHPKRHVALDALAQRALALEQASA